MGSKRVLIAEDDSGMLELLRYRLEREGYDVIAVTDGESALKVISDKQPDVSLLDRGLSGIDGLEVLKRLRDDDRTANARVVILSGRSRDQDAATLASIRPDDYLQKPVEPETVLQCIANQVDEAKAFDLDVVRSWLPDDEVARSHVKDHFLDIYGALLQQLQGGAERTDAKACASIAHRLAGSLVNLGADQAATLMREVERAGLDGSVQGVEQAVLATERVARELTIWLGEERKYDG